MAAREIHTRVAHAGFHDHRWFGHAVFGELLGDETALGLVLLSVRGRRATDEERALLEDLAVAVTVADPRIWPLKIARLLASYGGTMAGFGGAHLCVESDALGPWLADSAGHLLVDVGDAVDADDETFARVAREALRERPMPFGYGVPLRPEDERFLALRKRLELLGRTNLKWWRVQERLTRYMRAERKMQPNIGIGGTAMLLDMDLSPEQARVVTVFAMAHLFLANAVEGAEQRAEILQSLPVTSVHYAGPAPRVSPRARSPQ